MYCIWNIRALFPFLSCKILFGQALVQNNERFFCFFAASHLPSGKNTFYFDSYNTIILFMGSNQLSQDGVCYSFTFVPHTSEFSKKMPGWGSRFVCVDVCAVQVTVRQVRGVMMSQLPSPHLENPSWLVVHKSGAHNLCSAAVHRRCKSRKLLSRVSLPPQTFRTENKLA